MLFVYHCPMRTNDTHFAELLYAFLTNLLTQIRAGVVVGLPVGDECRSGAAPEVNSERPTNRHVIRSLDDYSGFLANSGLGSMDIGGGRSHIDE